MIFFRVDSGNHIGSGHLMRCLHLANSFFKLGYEIHFITKSHAGSIQHLIPDFFTTHLIKEGVVKEELSNEKNPQYQLWLGEDWQSDLERVNLILSQHSPNLIVIDHYSINSDYEKKIKCPQIMVIDDFLNRPHFCHYFLNQNLHAHRTTTPFTSKDNPIEFKGPKYALMDPKYHQLRNELPTRKSTEVKKILVFFGGSDINSDTLKLVSDLAEEYTKKYFFSFILSHTHTTYENVLYKLDRKFIHYDIHNFVDDMPSFVLRHDLFIGAGGSTSWERASLGIPSIILSVAENQDNICSSLHQLELAHFVKDTNSAEGNWNNIFLNIVSNKIYLNKLAQNSFKITDGLGSTIIAKEIGRKM